MKIRNSTYSAIAVVLVVSASVSYAGHTNLVLEAELDGREEVDDNDPTNRLPGDPNGKGEAYVFGIDGDVTTLCYQINVDKIQTVPVGDGMAAHIHEGVRDTNGPVVAVLAGPEDGNAADCLTEGEEGKFPTGETGIVQRILNNPEQFYINVHNPEFPAGAIRGNLFYQLEDDHEHDMPVSLVGAPSVPMNLSFVVYSPSAVELFWDRSTDDGVVGGYRVYLDGVFQTEVEGNSYFIEGLESELVFNYSIEAFDLDGNLSGPSPEIAVQSTP